MLDSGIAQRPIIPHNKTLTNPLSPVHPDEVLRVLKVTDSFNIHRETVFIPLRTEETGSVKMLPDGRLSVTCPRIEDFDVWLIDLRAALEKMDLSKLGKRQM